jgi:Glutathione-dependent formaldehyde-activating enzyme
MCRMLDTADAVAGAAVVERRANRQRFAAEPHPAAAVGEVNEVAELPGRPVLHRDPPIDSREYVRVSDEGEERTFRFCPECGATVFWTSEDWLPDTVAVAIGAFADRSFPSPTVSVYGSRRYPWLSLPEEIEEYG